MWKCRYSASSMMLGLPPTGLGEPPSSTGFMEEVTFKTKLCINTCWHVTKKCQAPQLRLQICRLIRFCYLCLNTYINVHRRVNFIAQSIHAQKKKHLFPKILESAVWPPHTKHWRFQYRDVLINSGHPCSIWLIQFTVPEYWWSWKTYMWDPCQKNLKKPTRLIGYFWQL